MCVNEFVIINKYLTAYANKKKSSIYNKMIYYLYVFNKTSNKTRCNARVLSSFNINLCITPFKYVPSEKK